MNPRMTLNMNHIRLIEAGLAALLLVCWTPGLRAADEHGHDHGDAPSAAAGPALPRFDASSESFELVGVLDGKRLTLYLDHAGDNSPVKDARLELDVAGTKVDVQPHGEGEFEALLAAEPKPGVFAITATVLAGKESDLLAGELDIHDEHDADQHEPAPAGLAALIPKAGPIGAAVVGLLALAAFGVHRLRLQRRGGAA